MNNMEEMKNSQVQTLDDDLLEGVAGGVLPGEYSEDYLQLIREQEKYLRRQGSLEAIERLKNK